MDHPAPSSNAKIAVILLLIGLPLCVGSGYWILKTRNFVDTAAAATGAVTGFVESRNNDDQMMYAPRVRFETSTGRPIEFKSKVSSSRWVYAKGERVEVLYDAQTPEKAVIRSFTSLWLFPAIGAGIGLLLVISGILTALGFIKP